MLKIILNRFKSQAEEIIAEEQAGFRAGRSTTEQIFNLRILCEKYLQHQQNLYHVLTDFKKAFDSVWHAALWVPCGLMLEALVESFDQTCTSYKVEISAKTKLMTISANDIQIEIKVNGQRLGIVTSFKYLGTVVSDDGSKPEVLSRITQATAALTKLKLIWRDNNISLGSKLKLMRSLVISIFLSACES